MGETMTAHISIRITKKTNRYSDELYSTSYVVSVPDALATKIGELQAAREIVKGAETTMQIAAIAALNLPLPEKLEED